MSKERQVSIILLTSMISRNSGGLSSALDIAETLHSLGYNIKIGLTGSSRFLYFIKDRKKYKTTIPIQSIYAIPHDLNKYLYLPFTGSGRLSMSARIKMYRKNSIKYNRNFLYEVFGRLIANIINSINSIIDRGKFYQSLRETDIIIVASGFFSGASNYLKTLFNGKIVFNHAGSIEAFESGWLIEQNRPSYNNKSKTLYHDFISQFDYILFQANDQELQFKQKYPELRDRTLVIKPTSNESAVHSSRQNESPYDSGKYIFLNVGSVQPRKAQDRSIQAFSEVSMKFPNSQLHFVGRVIDPQFKELIDNLIKDLQLKDRVFFHGHRQDYLRYMSHANVLLQTSTSEGVSRVLREAMLLKLPIISFAIPGTSDILAKGKEAILVEPFRINEFANAMEDLLQYPKKAEEYGQAAYKRYLSDHSKEVYTDSWIKAINKICKL